MNRPLSALPSLLSCVPVLLGLAGCDFTRPAGIIPPANANGSYSEQLVIDHGGSVIEVDTTTNLVVATIPMGTRPRAAVGLPDHRFIYFPDIGGIAKVGVLDGVTDERLEAVATGDPASGTGVGGGRAVAAMNGKLLYATSDPRAFTVAAIDTTINAVSKPGHGKDLNNIPVHGAPLALTTNRAGTLVYVLTESPGGATIDVIDASVLPVVDQHVVESFPLPPGARWQALVANGGDDELYYTSADGLNIVDVRAGSPTRGQVVAGVNVGPDPGEMVIDDKRRLYVLNESNQQLLIVDVEAGSPTRHSRVGGMTVGLGRFIARDVFSGVIYVANAIDRTLTAWQPAQPGPDTYAPSASLALPHPPQGLGIPKDGRLYVSMSAEAPAQVDMFDGVFPLGNWITNKVYDTTLSAAAVVSIGQKASGGDPDFYRTTTHQWIGGTTTSLGLEVSHLHALATHEPALAGAIDHVDVSFDVILLSQQGGTPGVAIFPLLQQNGFYYQFYDAGSPTAWTHKPFRGLTATDFTNAAIVGPVHPDFSTSGAPIQFGFGTANGAGGGATITTVSGIDNWNVVLTLR